MRKILCLILHIFLLCGCQTVLKKPYTLKIPVMLPIGGPIAPLGKMCTSTIDLFASAINNRSDILPDYNIIFDVVDDQCRDVVAIKTILPFFMSGQRIANLSGNVTNVDDSLPPTYIGQHGIPARPRFVTSSAEIGYIPPLLIGGMCSGVCRQVARYVHLFDFINFSAACNVGTLDDRKAYPDLFRIMSDGQKAQTAADFAKMMKVSRIAIISDPGLVSFMSTQQTISLFNKHDIKVVAVEFYNDDATDAVVRVKATNVRVVVANCYFQDCVQLACRISQQQFFGPNYIWIWPGTTDFVNSPSYPAGCTKEMLLKVEIGSFFLRQKTPDYLQTPIEIGLTGADLDAFLEREIPDIWSNRLVDSRWMCLDSVAPSAYILDAAEKQLKKQGSTLKDYIADHSKKAELRQIVREAVLKLDIRVFSGRIRYEHGQQEIIVPAGYDQAQMSKEGTVVRKMVYIDKGVDAVDEKSRYGFTNDPIVWLTKSGQQPKQEPSFVIERQNIPTWAGAVASLIAGVMLTFGAILVVLQYFTRKQSQVGHSLLISNCLALLGSSLLLAAVILYPALQNVGLFCKIVPVLVIIGYSIISGTLLIKLRSKPVLPNILNYNMQPHNAVIQQTSLKPISSKNSNRVSFSGKDSNIPSERPRQILPVFAQRQRLRDRNTLIIFSVWLGLNVILLGLWYGIAGSPVTQEIVTSQYDELDDVLHQRIWETCSSPQPQSLYLQTCSGTIMSLQTTAMIVATFQAVMKRQQVDSEVIATVRSVFILFPASVAGVLAVIIAADQPDLMYYFVSACVIVQCSAVMYGFFGAKRKLYSEVLSRPLTLLSRTMSSARTQQGLTGS